jgi:predicted PurR-regulated permease PerM
MPSLASRHPFFLGLLAAASIGFAAILFGFWRPIFWAAVIGILFRPVQTRLTARLDGRASQAAVLTVTLIFFTVLVPAMLLASAVAAEGANLYQRIQSRDLGVGEIVQWIKGLFPQAAEWAGTVGLNLDELPAKLSATALEASEFIASTALSAGQNVASFVLMFFLMLYLLFFVLRDGDLIMQHVHRAVPLPDELERQLFRKFAEVSRATIKGTVVVGLVQGFLGGLIFAILGIKGAVFWGVVMAVLSLLPAVGAGLVWGPAAVLLLIKGDWGPGLILVAYGVLVIGLADNLLRPILVGRDTKMPDYLILFSTLGGLGLVGITGFVLGPVIAALFMAAWQIYEQDHPAQEVGPDEGDLATGRTAAASSPRTSETERNQEEREGAKTTGTKGTEIAREIAPAQGEGS